MEIDTIYMAYSANDLRAMIERTRERIAQGDKYLARQLRLMKTTLKMQTTR